MTVFAMLKPPWGCGGQFRIALEAQENRVRGIEPMLQTLNVPAGLLHAKRETEREKERGRERERRESGRARARTARERERDRDRDRDRASLGTIT